MRETSLVARAAAAVADGEGISWPNVERLAASPDERALVHELHAISALSASSPGTLSPVRATLPRPMTFVLALALAQAIAATLTFATSPPFGLHEFRPAQAFLLVNFGLAALILRTGGRTDTRAQWLMAAYLLAAASFAHPFFSAAGAIGLAVQPLRWLALDAFLPYALWRFVQVFPRTTRFTWIDRAAMRAATLSLACALTLATANVLLAWDPLGASELLQRLGRDAPGRLYWNLVYPLVLAALIVCGLRAWGASAAERKRAGLFALPLVVGALPLIVKRILQVVGPAGLSAWMEDGAPKQAIDIVVLGSLALIPPATTYAVLAKQALTVRVVFHGATRYLLARTSVAVLAALPAAMLARHVYLHRDRPLDRMFADTDGRVLILWLAAAVALFLARRQLAGFVDRRFQSLRPRPHQALAAAVAAIHGANGAGGVAAAVARELERLFGAPAGVLQCTERGALPLHGALSPVPPTSALVVMSRVAREPTLLGTGTRFFRLLPQPDRDWIAASQTEMLLPLHSADGEPLALVAAGRKASGLAWTADDLALVAALGQSCGLALELALREQAATSTEPDETWSVECVRCGRVANASEAACVCGGAVQPSLLPALLHGKFAVESRIGAGGMGVVYRGRDRTLGRAVAMKTLPALEPGAAARMREEARTMAALIHTNLALIFDIEVWHHTPVLVMEYLDGGTLADRMRRGPLPLDEALALARNLADALGALHAAGFVHGDVKPSNIGFTRAGVPKLLDFGLSRLTAAAYGDATDISAAATMSTVSTVRGTPLYLPPEAFDGAPQSRAFDLWALALVVFEAIAGAHPFAAADVLGIVLRMAGGPEPDIRNWVPAVPAPLAAGLSAALSLEPHRRPSTAEEFRALLTA